MRRPWEVSKAFARSAPIGPLHTAAEVGHPAAGAVLLKVNGEVRQQGDLGQMIWKVPEMISHLSDYLELEAGDIILSGTPSGMNSVKAGDVMEAPIAGFGALRVRVE